MCSMFSLWNENSLDVFTYDVSLSGDLAKCSPERMLSLCMADPTPLSWPATLDRN